MKDEITNKTEKEEMVLITEKREEKIRVRRGEIYTSETGRLRVIDVREAGIMIIDLETNKIRLEKCGDFIRLIEMGELEKAVIEPVKQAELSKEELKRIKERKEIMENILEATYPCWDTLFQKTTSKPYFSLAAVNLGITRRRLHDILKTYLRSGRDMFSLADKRKFNQRPISKPPVDINPRENKAMLLNFALKEFYRTESVTAAYESMVSKFFRDEVVRDGVAVLEEVPDEEITVSPKQVRTYIEKNLGGLTIKQWKKGERITNDTERDLIGGVKYDLSGLGQRYEIDECELPCYVVDPQFPDAVGKPVMYLSVDEYVGIINGCYISHDNNSCNGVRQLFLSMLEPHKNQTDKYGVFYDEDVFPSMCMPRIGESNFTSNGYKMTIIAYRNNRDIDVQFEDGSVVKKQMYNNFKSGYIRYPGLRVGEKLISKNGQVMTIIKYRNCNDIDVEFEDGTIVTGKKYGAFKNKRIRNPNLKISKKGHH